MPLKKINLRRQGQSVTRPSASKKLARDVLVTASVASSAHSSSHCSISSLSRVVMNVLRRCDLLFLVGDTSGWFSRGAGMDGVTAAPNVLQCAGGGRPWHGMEQNGAVRQGMARHGARARICTEEGTGIWVRQDAEFNVSATVPSFRR